jgi:hypothetical protein
VHVPTLEYINAESTIEQPALPALTIEKSTDVSGSGADGFVVNDALRACVKGIEVEVIVRGLWTP